MRASQATRRAFPRNRDYLPQVGLRRVLGCRGASHASVVAPRQRPCVLGGVPRRVRRHGLPRTGAATPAVLSRPGRSCAQVHSRPRSPARPLLCYELLHLKTLKNISIKQVTIRVRALPPINRFPSAPLWHRSALLDASYPRTQALAPPASIAHRTAWPMPLTKLRRQPQHLGARKAVLGREEEVSLETGCIPESRWKNHRCQCTSRS